MPKTLTPRKLTPPKNPESGNFIVRLDPDLAHAALAKAHRTGVSRNTYVAQLIARDLKRAA